jgi:mannosylglycerate hydrolase
MSIREIHVVPNTHWDREFRESFEKTRDNLVEMMDRTVDILLENPAYTSYTLDAHCIMLLDYLEMRPERTEEVTRLLKERRLLIGPWYTLPDSPNVGMEALARNFLQARKVADHFGVDLMRAGYTPCNWGQPSQLPQIFKQIGVESALFYRGISPHECPAEWIWVAPDGSEIVGHRFALFARYNWYYFVFRPVTYDGIDPYEKKYQLGSYGENVFRFANSSDDATNFHNFRVVNPDPTRYDQDQLLPALDRLLEMEGPHFSTPYFLAMHGHDVSVAHPMDPQAVADANKGQDKYKVVMSDLETYMDKVRDDLAKQKNVTRLHGERRMNLKSGFWTYLLPGTISARTYLKIDNARTEWMLHAEAEPFAVMGLVNGRPYPKMQLERAWKYLLDCHTHDAIAGCAPDTVTSDIEFRLRQSRDLAEVVTDRSLQYVVNNLDLNDAQPDDVHMVLFNPLPYPRSEAVQMEVAFPASKKAKGLKLTTWDGDDVDYQTLSVKEDSFFVDSIWDVPKNTDVTKFTIIAQVNDVPAMGYKTLKAIPLDHPERGYGSLMPEENVIENAFLRVTVNANGSVDVLHKEAGKTYSRMNWFRDEGVAGNAWKHEWPERNSKQNTLGGEARLSVVKDGSLEAIIRADLVLEIPVDLENREVADGRTVSLPISTQYTLRRDDPKLYVSTTVQNGARDHWLRAMFPTGLKTDVVHAETHFDLTDRPIPHPDCHDWYEEYSGTAFMQSMVSLDDGKEGFSLLSQGLYEYEAFDDSQRTLGLTLLRAMWIKLEVSEEKKQVLPDLGMQCPGAKHFEYVLYPHAGDCLHARALEASQRHRTPLTVAQCGRSGGHLPLEESLLDTDGSDVVITCIKKAEDSDRIVVRGYNPRDTEGRLALRTGFALHDVVALNLHERDEQALEHGEFELEMAIPAKRIFTIGMGY